MSSHDGDAVQQPSCTTTVPLGKSVRRALRAAIGMPKKPRKDKLKPKKEKPNKVATPGTSSSSSTELVMSLSKEAAAAIRESVVRVVLSSGVVEVYPSVVLACAVIRRHPPGLCLAHPDVFRNPHGAVIRPLEPLFPGQKFLLMPWSTVDKLKHRIPESSIGAFDEDDDDRYYDTTGSEEDQATSSSTETEATYSEEDQLEHSGGGAAAGDDDDDVDGSFMPACNAREYFVARDRWSECRFKRLVAQGLAVEPSADDDDDHQQPDRQRKDKQQQAPRKKGSKNKKKRKAGNNKKRRERPSAAGPPAGFRAFATLRRTWEPSLPSVEEEEISTPSSLLSPVCSSIHRRIGGHQVD